MVKRYNYISYMRVFAMLSVILGHTAMYGSNVMVEIYKIVFVYHIPLFVFISGYLFWDSSTKKERTWYKLAINKFCYLAIPAFGVAFLIVLPTELFITRITSLTIQSIIDRIQTIFLGEVGHLWFMLMLFWIFLFFIPIVNIMKKCNNNGLLIFVDICVLVGTILLFLKSKVLWNITFYSINQTARYLYYFGVGIVCAQFKDGINSFITSHKKFLVPGSIVVLVNLAEYVVHNYETYVGAWFISSHIESYLVISTLFIFIIYECAVIWDGYRGKLSNIVALLDNYSMQIYFVHIAVGEIAIKIMQSIGNKLQLTVFNKICFTFCWMVLISVMLVYRYNKLVEKVKKCRGGR